MIWPASFVARIHIESNGCWTWTAGAWSKFGHGAYWFEGRQHHAHRWSYEFFNQCCILPEYHADHFACNNPPCVNPQHIRPTTPKDNTLRSLNAPAAINARKTHCINGHPLSGNNLYNNWQGRRVCGECKRIRNRKNRTTT